MILVFDLDNTLYDERAYVESGFRAVAAHARKTFGIPAAAALAFMRRALRSDGRGRIFDDLLRRHGHFSKKNVAACLSVYRLHRPTLSLDPDARRCLTRFRRLPLYIVTDGNKNTQARKIRALGLEKRVKKSFITYRYGLARAKPSSYCFERIAHLERVAPSEVVYIADDPRKDFVGIKPLGFRTIRVRKGPYKNLRVKETFNADATIHDLDGLDEAFLKRLVR